MRRPPHFISAILLLVVVPAGCRTDPLSSTSSPGTAAQVTPANACAAVAAWYEPYKREFPDVWISVASSRHKLAAANLFRASTFSRVFGDTYTFEHHPALRQKYTESIVPCYEDSQYESLMRILKPFLGATFEKFHPELADHAARVDAMELWMGRSLREMESVPASLDGLVRLEQLGNEARDNLIWLLPSEKANFQEQLEARQKSLAGELIARLDPVPLPPTPENIRLIYRLVPYGGAGEGELALRQRLQTMLSRMTKEKNAEIENIPLTLEGRDQSARWYESFNRAYSDMRSNIDVTRVYGVWAQRRNKIYRATMSDFVARLEGVKSGEHKSQQYRTLLAETFPLPYDNSMEAYQEYKNEILEREKTSLQKLAARGKVTFEEIHRALSQFAHDIVHGRK